MVATLSYLNNIRVVFSGTFQADTSTVNNDVRHYDNATFEPRFQDARQADGTENGWSNPNGSGAFRLIGCRISEVHYGDGTSTCSVADDFAVGLMIGGANERVAAKMVDLDPQWQLASEIWGLRIRLTAGDGNALVQGQFMHSAFRDLVFRRILVPGGVGSDGDASASFQSVIQDVDWAAAASESRVLRELKARTNRGELSVRLMTFAYVGKPTDPRFSLGKVCGVIGPVLPDEPKSFILGRRFVAAGPKGQSWNGINYFTGAIDRASSTLMLDLGNALQLSDGAGTVCDIGKLSVGTLLDPSLPEKSPTQTSNFETLSEIDYRAKNWLFQTSGIYTLPLSAGQLAATLRAPLALAVEQPDGSCLIAIRENAHGLMSCAEEFIHRIDAPGSGALTIYTAKFGLPFPGAKILFKVLPEQAGWSDASPTDPNPPKAPIPNVYAPTNAITFPSVVAADAAGRADIVFHVTPPGNPRGYLDGQIYGIKYGIDGELPNAHAPFDVIMIHVRDSFVIPDKPAWMPDIAPIFTQYGNLYPIMSQRLVDLSNPESVRRNLRILQLAFSLDIDDPNYMPVTRDLSENKRIAIQLWLQRLETDDDPTFLGGPRLHSAKLPAAQSVSSAAPIDTSEPVGGKTTFARNVMREKRE